MTPMAAQGPMKRTARAMSAGVLVLEVVGSALMWAPIPLAWMWIGGRVNEATGSLAAGGAVTFAGFVASTVVAMSLLTRLDEVWITLRRRAGHDQREGALTQVVVVSATLGIAAFVLWYYVIGQAYLIPFMPTHGGP
jgi:hypothetical protein